MVNTALVYTSFSKALRSICDNPLTSRVPICLYWGTNMSTKFGTNMLILGHQHVY